MKTLRSSESLAVFLSIHPLSRSVLLDMPIDELDSLRLAVLHAQLELTCGRTLATVLMRAFIRENGIESVAQPPRRN